MGGFLPTIEFFGYYQEKRSEIELRIRGLLEKEPFREDCVFVVGAGTTVRDWQGLDRPFVRVSTRSAERAARFRSMLHDVCDLEVVRIDFQPMTPPAGE